MAMALSITKASSHSRTVEGERQWRREAAKAKTAATL